MNLNKLLLKQIKKHLGEEVLPEKFLSLLEDVSRRYDDVEKDRRMLERVLEVSTAEMAELHKKLKSESDELKVVNHQLTTLFENMEDAFFTVDRVNNKVLLISPSCEKVYGYPPASFYTNANLWLELIVDEDKHIVLEREQVIHNGKSFVIEYRIKHKSGNIRWLESKIVPTVSSDGVLLRLDGVTSDITDKKQALETISKSRQQLLDSQRIAHIGSWELALDDLENLNKNILQWSEETYRILGFEPNEVESTNDLFFSLVHPDDREKITSNFSHALETLSLYSVEHRIITKDGKEKTVHERGEIVTDGNNRPVKILGTLQDVTHRKIAETELKKAEASLRAMLENTDTSYVLVDEEFTVLLYNRTAIEMGLKEAGRAPKVGEHYINFLPESRRKDVLESLKYVLREGKPLSYEVTYDHGEGKKSSLYVRMHPVSDDTGKTIGLSIAATDINYRKKAEQQIKESNERYKMVAKATNDVVWDWDIITNNVYRSENYKNVFGYDPVEGNIYVRSWIDNIHPDDRGRVYEGLMKCLSDSKVDVWEDEYRYYRSNGEIAYVSDRAYIIYDGQKPVRMVGAMQDVTAKKIAEMEHEKMTADLIQRNNDLEQFAYIISHNLRAPVANIIAFSEAIDDTDLTENEKAEFMQGLSASVKKLDSVILDLNYILQIKREVSEKREQVYFADLVSDITLSIDNMMQKENVQINTNFREVETICTLKSYMYSIFYNLIVNSIKYRRQGVSPVIEISSRLNGDTLQLIFKDNGLGFDMKRYGTQVFKLYKRFHPDIEGKGMGLFMTRNQVETLGGKISLDSKVNEGSEFKIEFDTWKTRPE